MNCKDIENLLADQPLAALSSEQRNAVSAHVAGCAACRERWGMDAESQVFHDEAKALRSPNGVKDAVMAKLGTQEPPSAAKPSRIGGFELLATLGKGGMGTVFRARQVSMDRIVALKVLPPNLAKNQDFVQRFLREARSAAKLNHTNIVQGFDVGEAGGVYYFAMEFVDGPTLKDLIKREGRLDEKKALTIIGAVARALEEAHRHGLIHRDIKPDNIMINSRGIVKLADLGLAKSTSLPEVSHLREGKYEETLTLEGTVVGTPHYMAPEQARGDADIDTRCDIYALGATLYQMVTGEFPYSGPTPAAIMAKHITEPPPNPKEKNPALSRPACDLVQRMMAKDPADRPQTPTELLAEVRDALEGKVKLRPLPAAVTRDLPAASSPLPPGEGRVRDAASHLEGRKRGSPLPPGEGRVREARSHLAGREHKSPLPWLLAGAGLLLAAGALLLILRPGKTAEPQAKAKEDLTAKVAKDAKGKEGTTSQIEAKADAERQFQARLDELKSACAALAAKDQFGQAIARIDATTSSLPKVSYLREGISALRSSLLSKAEERYTALARAVDAAIEAKDYPKARAALAPAESLGVPDLADRAKKKLEEIASREKSAEAWAKWDAIKAQAKKLIDAAKLDEAAQLFEGAKALPLDGIADLVAEQVQSIASTKSTLLKAALAAYAAESDKVWALFKDRKYSDADKLLATLAASLPKAIHEKHLREGIARPLQADQEAARLLKEFWAAVEKGLAAKTGQFVSFKSAAGGTLLSVQDGAATVKTPQGKSEPRPVQDLLTKQALAALADLKDDPHSNLLKGVFRLAEGEDLPKAEEAFDKAGDEPNVARYRERLAALAPPKVAAPPETTPKEQPGPTRKWVVYKEWPFDAAEAVRRQKATAQALGVKIEQGIDLGKGVKMAFVLIPAGEFLMGSPPTTSPEKLENLYGKHQWTDFSGEFPQHRVRITTPFWLGKFEVTQEQWQAVMGDNPSGNQGKPQNPVENVSWSRSSRFVDELSAKVGREFRLPTEGEWEYGCRAGSAGDFCFGDRASEVKDYGWYIQNSGGSTQPVGRLEPNAWGLLDMHGNVWESCQDWFGPYAKQLAIDPKGPATGPGRVNRGGSCGQVGPHLWGLRSAYRSYFNTEQGSVIAGFRVLLERSKADGGITLREPNPVAEDPKAGKWVSLFDGKSLGGWKVMKEGDFATGGKVRIEKEAIFLDAGEAATAIAWTRNGPTMDYEISWEAARMAGGANFSDLVFPVGTSICSLCVGGNGDVLALQQVDGKNVWENETLKHVPFEQGRFYAFRLRVTRPKIQMWLDGTKMIDLPTAGHSFSVWGGANAVKPLGFLAWRTPSAIRNIRVRPAGKEEEPAAEDPKAGKWQSLFDGKTIEGWRKYEARGQDTGTLGAKDGQITLGYGNPHAGMIWTGDFPKIDYEFEMKVSSLEGYNRPCVLSFPVQESMCTLFFNGGTHACLSKIGGQEFGVPDGKPGAEKQWYDLRLRVMRAKIEVWADGKKLLDVAIPPGAAITCQNPDWGIKELNIRTWKTAAAFRNLRFRRIGE